MNIENMTSKELKAMAKELKVKNWWNLKKAELITAIQSIQNDTEDAEETTNEESIVEEENVSEDYTIVTKNSNGGVTVIAECHHEDITQNAQDDSEETEKPAKKSRGKMIEYNGESKNLNQWAKELGMSGQTLFARIYISGWTVEKAFTTPTKPRKKKTEEEA